MQEKLSVKSPQLLVRNGEPGTMVALLSKVRRNPVGQLNPAARCDLQLYPVAYHSQSSPFLPLADESFVHSALLYHLGVVGYFLTRETGGARASLLNARSAVLSLLGVSRIEQWKKAYKEGGNTKE